MNKQVIINSCLRYRLGTPLSIKKFNNAAVHQVYRVKTDKGIYFIKYRGNYYAKSPTLSLDPSEMKFEAIVTDILHNKFPNNIPRKIIYDENESILVTSKIMDEKDNLEVLLDRNILNSKDINNIGYTLGKIHKTISNIKQLSATLDDELYERNLFYKFISLECDLMKPIVDQLRLKPRQLIIGDLSPKNIGLSKGRVVFCDFDNAHIGNRIFDAGFLLGHLILHTYSRNNIDLISFINGYNNGISTPLLDEEKNLIYKVALATCIYRLDNNWVKYKLNLDSTESNILLAIVKNILKKEKVMLISKDLKF